jgi:uncharacterized membrane protein YphA (DoxX/SURF4 family)
MTKQGVLVVIKWQRRRRGYVVGRILLAAMFVIAGWDNTGFLGTAGYITSKDFCCHNF